MTSKRRLKNSNPLPPSLDLDLLEDPAFVSTPPKLSAEEMAKVCEAMLPYWNKRRFIDGVDTAEPANEKFVI